MSVDGAEGPALQPVWERAVLVRFLVGILLLVIGVGALGWAFRAPLAELSAAFVGRFGTWGLFFGMLIIDAYAFPPLAHEPILFFAHAGGVSFVDVTLVAGTASFLAGPVGYVVGRLLGQVVWVRRQLARTGVTPVMRRRGAWVVALAAVSPVPFSASTYIAGALRVPFAPFLLACALRYLKVAAYLAMIAVGWSFG